MATAPINCMVQHIRRAVLLEECAGLTDGQLLDCFLEQRDPTAFGALVRRHGPMVWGVCRRVLADHHDAEDAFQATFLVLLRRAKAVWPREMIANWLYGVARKTAMKARAISARRMIREKQVVVMPEPPSKATDLDRDLHDLLDQELGRLPEIYRVAIVLCDLEGKTRREAAQYLGVPDGTLAARLARARVLLSKRLSRRGLGLSGRILAGMLSAQDASGSVPASLVSVTLAAAGLAAAGQGAAEMLRPVRVAALAEGVLKSMTITKLKIVSVMLLAFAVSGAGSLVYWSGAISGAYAQDDAPRRATAPARIEQKDLDLAIRTLANYGKQIKEAEQTQKRDAAVAGLFKHRVPFKLGYTEFIGGGHLEILEVWGSRPSIEIGGQYLVRGKYVLPTHSKGRLYFWLTALNWDGSGPSLDLQRMDVSKGQGEFALIHSMAGPGFFHVVLSGSDRAKPPSSANVYFGTGSNVWERKP